MTLEIDFKFPDWAGKLKAHEQELNLLQAAVIQTNRGMLFDNEGAYNGHAKWARLSLRNGQILSKRGTLRKSIAPFNAKGHPGPDGIVRFTSDSIIIGTHIAYAKMMNYGTTGLPGGVLRPKRAKALKIPLPPGKSATQYARSIARAPNDKRVAKAEAAVAKARDRAKHASTVEAKMRAMRSYNLARERLNDAKVKRFKGHGEAKFMFRKWVKIPPRNFIDWNEHDQAELDSTLLSKVSEILNG